MLLQMIRTKRGAQEKVLPRKETALRRAKGLLRAKGKRITAQRVLLLEIIQGSDGHLDAEELYRRAKRRDPRINLATVYRTRNLLKESGLVQPTFLSRAHQRELFESRPDIKHYHFACVTCGKVIEFETPLVDQLGQEATLRLGVEVMRGWLWLEGLCPECRGKVK